VVSPVLASDGTIYVGSYDYSLYALNPDGTLKWTYVTADRFYNTPAVALDGTIYFHVSTTLFALTPAGALKWSHSFGEDSSIPVFGPRGQVYVHTSTTIYVFNTYGVVVDTYSPPGSAQITTLLTINSNGTIYFGSGVNIFCVQGSWK